MMWRTYLALVALQSADIRSWKNQQLCILYMVSPWLVLRYVLHAFPNMGTIANILTWSTWPPARCTSWRSAALLCRAHQVYKIQLYNQLFNYHCCVALARWSMLGSQDRSQDHHYIIIIISNTTINTLINYVNIDKDYSNKGRRPEKKLLFFWVLSKCGGRGPALFTSACLVNKWSLFPPKCQ